jgi:hypothetical protein
VGGSGALRAACALFVQEAAVSILVAVVVLKAEFVAGRWRCGGAGGGGRAAPQAAKEVDQGLHDAGVCRIAAAGDGGKLGLGLEQALALGVVGASTPAPVVTLARRPAASNS